MPRLRKANPLARPVKKPLRTVPKPTRVPGKLVIKRRYA